MSKPASGNPLSLGLVIVGAAALAISVFLPLVQQTTLIPVQDNTLIQHGGWIFLGAAVGLVGTGYRAFQGKQTERWLLILLCAGAAFFVVLDANDKGLRTLYPIGADGNAITTQPGTVASLAIAIYVAGAGVGAAFIGALTFFQSTNAQAPAAKPAPQRSTIAPKPATPAARPAPRPKQQRTQAEWEAEVEAAEAEAEAATARARAIRLRLEAGARTDPAASPEEPEAHQASAPPASRTAPPPDLRVDDQVQILAPGNDYLKVGTVTRVLGDDEVEVKLGKLAGTYTYGADELQVMGRKIRW